MSVFTVQNLESDLYKLNIILCPCAIVGLIKNGTKVVKKIFLLKSDGEPFTCDT